MVTWPGETDAYPLFAAESIDSAIERYVLEVVKRTYTPVNTRCHLEHLLYSASRPNSCKYKGQYQNPRENQSTAHLHLFS